MLNSYKNFTLLLFSLLAACQPKPLLNETINLAGEQWTYADTLNFQLNLQDTALRYDIFIDLQHSPDYPTQNLYTRIYTLFPNGERPRQLVSLELADKAGQWYGRCGGKWCKLSIPIQQGALFDQAGAYTFTLEQYTRIDPLPGLKQVGMRIQPSKK